MTLFKLHVPLQGSTFNFAGLHLEDHQGDGLLPRSGLTASTLLGGSSSERETVGRLLATQIATAILTKNPEDNRALVLGLGLKNLSSDRNMFFEIIDLVLSCL